MKIVNVRGMKPNSSDIVYCGRAFAGWKESLLHNPFHEGKDGTREEVIEKFRQYLWRVIQDATGPCKNVRNYYIYEKLLNLPEDATLGCWCHPKPCHCEVIIRAYHWVQEQWKKEQ